MSQDTALFRDENQARASDPDASAWVSANAGTGKTAVLVRRVLRLLLAGVEPDVAHEVAAGDVGRGGDGREQDQQHDAEQPALPER